MNETRRQTTEVVVTRPSPTTSGKANKFFPWYDPGKQSYVFLTDADKFAISLKSKKECASSDM